MQLIVFFFCLPFYLAVIYLIIEAIPPYSPHSKRYRPSGEPAAAPLPRRVSLREDG